MTFIKRKQCLGSICLLLAVLLPHNNTFLLFLYFLLPIILFITTRENNAHLKSKGFLFLFITTISFSFYLLRGNTISFKEIARFINILILFICFPFIGYFKLSNKLIYFIVGVLLFSQLAYVFNVGSLVSFFDFIYPYNGDVRGFTTEFILQSANDIDLITQRRYGGIFHNPNQFMKYLSSLYVIYLLENHTSKKYTGIVLFSVSVFISVLLTGSRTGLIVFFTILVWYLLFIKRVNKSFVFLFCFFLFGSLYMSQLGFRIFNISEGISTSLFVKLQWFSKAFFEESSLQRWIFGNFTTESVTSYNIPLLDSEWGELFFRYGLLGFLSFVCFFIYIYKSGGKYTRFIFILYLWGVTSTILFSYRMSFLFMFILSIYYSKDVNND